MPERRQFVGNATTAEADQFTGLSRELTINMQANAIRVHDGVTKGGHEMARYDLANVSNSVFAKRLTNKEDKSNKVSEIFKTLPADNYPNVKAIEKYCNQFATKDLANLTKDALSVIVGACQPIIANNDVTKTALIFPWGYAVAYGINESGGDIEFPITFTEVPCVFIQGMFTGNQEAGWPVVEQTTRFGASVSFRNYENSHYWKQDNKKFGWLAIGPVNATQASAGVTSIIKLDAGLIKTVSVTAVPADDIGGSYAKKCLCITTDMCAIAVPFSFDSLAPSAGQLQEAYQDWSYDGSTELNSGYYTTETNKGDYPVNTWCPARAEDLSDRIGYYRSDGTVVRNIRNTTLAIWGWRDGNYSTKVDGYTYSINDNDICTLYYNGDEVLVFQ